MINIQTWGVGRRDYSDNIELSTVPIVRSHQFRYSVCQLYPLVPPGGYITYCDWDILFQLEGIVGGQFINFYECMCTTDNANVLVMIGLADNYDFATGIANVQCMKLGYGEAKIIISHGFKFDLRGVLNPEISGTFAGWPLFIFGNYGVNPENLIIEFQAMGSVYA